MLWLTMLNRTTLFAAGDDDEVVAASAEDPSVDVEGWVSP